MDLRIAFLILLSSTISRGFLFKRGKHPLAIDGGWSSWQSWSSCHLNSANQSDFFPDMNGFLVSSRKRNCDSPRPVQGGKPCHGSSFRYRQCGCKNPLGMETGKIADSQITSNAGVYREFDVSKGRLGSSAAWCSADPISPFLDVYYKIDFINFTKVTAIATEGISLGRVSRYRVFHSLDNKEWALYEDKYRQNSEFIGNILPNKLKMNELARPFVTRYLKILPLHSYDRVCMKLEVYGCPFTCGTQMAASSGEVIGRSAETQDQNCVWKINVENTTTISLDFLTFYIPCDEGFLEIREGSQSYQDSKVLRRKCGEDLSVSLYKPPTNSMWLHFYSNSSSDEIGFRLRYISECFKNLVLKGTETLRITTPNYPKDYFDNNDCTWDISSPSNFIYVWFKMFDIEASRLNGKENCSNDFILVEGLFGKGLSRSMKYCNSHKPPVNGEPVILKTNKARLHFKSDDVITGKGFWLEITSYDKRKGKPTDSPLKNIITTERLKDKPSEEHSKTSKTPPNQAGTLLPKTLISDQGFNESKIQDRKNFTNVGGHLYPVKKKTNKESDWTIFTVAAFSCFVFILIVFVTVISIRKCTSRYRGESGKFLPAISKKPDTDESYQPKDILLKSKKSFALVTADDQLCEVKSPAGSIQVASSDGGSDHGEQEPLTADIVNHTLKREQRRSYIDMYTDGGNELERTFEPSADTLSPDISSDIEETII